MVELQFKSVCRLNRLLIMALIALSLNEAWGHAAIWAKAFFIGLFCFHSLFLLGNEFLLKMMKRLREAELQTVAHLSIILPCAVALYASVNYALTGSFMVYLLGFFSILEAQFLAQPKLSRILAIVYGGIFLLGIAFGFPRPVSFTPLHLAFTAFGWGGCVYYYGTMVARLVRSHSTQVGKLQSIAATDVLTGLTNRRQFNSRLHEEISRARRHETPLTLALFDLDDFKRLNDFYGHPVGDRILSELGKLIRQNIRESDLPARYGGEEFALILPETRENEGYELLERIRLLVAQTVFCLPDNPLTITISVGIAQLQPREHTAFELVEFADKALYEAKRQGKNQVIRASSIVPKVILKNKPNGLPFTP